MKLKTLLIITAVLCAFSVVIFINENKRGRDLLSGSDYIKGLDVGKIHRVTISSEGNDKINLAREGDRFIIESHKSYQASSEKINDLIYKIAEIQVKEKIVSNPNAEDLKKFELDEKSRKVLIEIFDNDKAKTISFGVGKSYKGKGNYLYRENGKNVYLSLHNVWVNTSYKDYIDTNILNIKGDEVESVRSLSARGFEIIKKDKGFELMSLKTKKVSSKVKEEKLKNYIDGFSFAAAR